MRTLDVAEVSIDESGRLLIRPREPDDSFQFVYRAAAEVGWDPVQACFTCPKPREWSYVRWFQQARSAVGSELGWTLKVTRRTTWTNIPDVLREEIRAASLAG
jgi:hypothetical protein